MLGHAFMCMMPYSLSGRAVCYMASALFVSLFAGLIAVPLQSFMQHYG